MIANSKDNIDGQLLDGFDINDLNLDDVHSYKELMAKNTGNPRILELNDQEFLQNTGAFHIDRRTTDRLWKLTVGGLLFF